MTTGQAELVALHYEDHFAGIADKGRRPSADKPWADLPEVSGPRARDRAGRLIGVSGRAVGHMKRVAAQAPELVEQIAKGALDAADKV